MVFFFVFYTIFDQSFSIPENVRLLYWPKIIVRGAAGAQDSHLLYIKIVNRQNGRVRLS